MVVAVVVVVGDSPTEGIVSCSRVVVGAVGAFCGEPAFEGFARRFVQECAVTLSAVARVLASSAVMRGGAQSLVARTRSWSSARLPSVGVFALVGSGCPIRSRRLARMRASGVIVSLGDEVVTSVVIACSSSHQPYSFSTSVKCGGETTRR